MTDDGQDKDQEHDGGGDKEDDEPHLAARVAPGLAHQPAEDEATAGEPGLSHRDPPPGAPGQVENGRLLQFYTAPRYGASRRKKGVRRGGWAHDLRAKPARAVPLAINLKAAKALGVRRPPLLQRAHQPINDGGPRPLTLPSLPRDGGEECHEVSGGEAVVGGAVVPEDLPLALLGDGQLEERLHRPR